MEEPPEIGPDTSYDRLENQIRWYDRKSLDAQRTFRRLKTVQIVVAAAVPTSALLVASNAAIPGILGAVVLVLEGLQELGSYQRNWQKYRSSCEALRQEKYLFLALAGPYGDLGEAEARRVLAERTEMLISQEHTQWVAQFRRRGPEGAEGDG